MPAHARRACSTQALAPSVDTPVTAVQGASSVRLARLVVWRMPRAPPESKRNFEKCSMHDRGLAPFLALEIARAQPPCISFGTIRDGARSICTRDAGMRSYLCRVIE